MLKVHTSVRNVDGNIEKKDEPSLRIDDGFNDLIPFPYVVDDTSLVSCKSLNPEYLFLLRKEEGIHRRVREKDEGEDGPRH